MVERRPKVGKHLPSGSIIALNRNHCTTFVSQYFKYLCAASSLKNEKKNTATKIIYKYTYNYTLKY